MKTAIQLSNQDLSAAITSFLQKSHKGINLNVLGIGVDNGVVDVQAEILPRERKVRGPNKRTLASRKVTVG